MRQFMISMSFFSAPEESYSRELDKHVASQEFPYGKPYDPGFFEQEREIESVERKDIKGGQYGRKGKTK